MRARRQRRREPAIALINIVFLILIFFLLAGTVAPPLADDLSLVTARDLPPEGPPDALVVQADGAVTWRGTPLSDVGVYLAALEGDADAPARIVPDRDAPAQAVLRLGQELRAAGAESVTLVTQRGLP